MKPLPLLVLLLAMGSSHAAEGQTPPSVEGSVPGNQLPPKKTSWRTRYELGPGDSLNLSFYGRSELNREGLRVAPDGTISYLQARDIKVAGLTVDEARQTLEKSLAAHYRSPRLILVPQEVASKRYTILGMVQNRGVCQLDRPVTLLEAIANAGGLATGLYERNTIELADLDRSFITRNGQRLPVDFRKLLLQGDMTQNVDVEPDDFIFLASNLSNNFFIFGEVNSPGVQGLTATATVTEAITRRMGFTNKAWIDRILVIRGSLDNPETHVVNLAAILSGKEKDFHIMPKDIVYVADRPWSKAEDILENVLTSFFSSAATNWINQSVNPIIKDPLIKTN